MSHAVMRDLASRHGRDPAELIEAWEERAAIREYLGGFGRQAAEVFAIGDVEQMLALGLHDPVACARWRAGGQRVR